MLEKMSGLGRLYRCICIGKIGDRSGWSGGMAVLACSLLVLLVCLCVAEALLSHALLLGGGRSIAVVQR